jgi:hypothetical protein
MMRDDDIRHALMVSHLRHKLRCTQIALGASLTTSFLATVAAVWGWLR